MEKERPKSGNQKQLPKDAQVIISILKELGVEDFENRVINQLLEFTYRYVTCILDDAKVYANHAKKKVIDLEDVKLASTLLLDKAFTGPPPREVLLEVARAKNSQPLSFIKPHSGIRLPPERYCLLAQNYKLRAASSANPTKKLMKSAIEPRSTIKTQFKSPASSMSQSSNKQPSLSQSQTISQSEIIIPRPFIKVQGNKTQVTKIVPKQISTEIKMEVDDHESGGSMKRKRSEDEFEIVT